METETLGQKHGYTEGINSAIHKVAGLTFPGCSMISTGTIPVELKSVHWL